MPAQSFSAREGLREGEPIIYDDAPEALRYGLREVLHVLGYQTPTAQRRILCRALRVSPNLSNWSDYPNVEDEVVELILTEPWYKFFDAMERLPRLLPDEHVPRYYDEVNALFVDEQAGYRFESGNIVRLGTQEFHAALDAAKKALQDDRFEEPRRQFERACEFRNSRPADWPNAIKEAVNSVEAIMQIICNRPGVALTNIVSESLPANLPGGIRSLLKALYSYGSGTVGARHASIGGNIPTGPRAELAIHVAAALHEFAVSELDLSSQEA